MAAGPAAAVQAPSSTQEAASVPRWLTFEEGTAIVNAAYEHRERVRHQPDCSHLVHQLYVLAGFPYPYASSFDLYAGIVDFARVEAPQPGDLIVWRGHVGVVVDPAQRSFYSSVSRGLRTDYYDSSYWLQRGPARFYRYVLGGAGGVAFASARGTPPGSQPPVQVLTVPVLDEEPAPGAAPRPIAESSPSAAATAASRPAPATSGIPAGIVIVAPQAQPTPEEITEAIFELSNAAAGLLQTPDLIQLPRPVVIFHQLRVERLDVRSGRGWAHVRVESQVSLAGTRIELKRRREKRRWELRRTGSDWWVVTPRERVYVPRDVAVHVLATQLAALTRPEAQIAARNPAALARQQAQLAGILNALLEEK